MLIFIQRPIFQTQQMFTVTTLRQSEQGKRGKKCRFFKCRFPFIGNRRRLVESISSTCLCVAFTLAYPKSAKSCLSWLSFCAFGICKRKSCMLNVGEIDPCWWSLHIKHWGLKESLIQRGDFRFVVFLFYCIEKVSKKDFYLPLLYLQNTFEKSGRSRAGVHFCSRAKLKR